MKTTLKVTLMAVIAAAALIFGIGIGSVYVSPADILAILGNRLFQIPLPESINPVYPKMVMDMRLPRVLMAFLTGAALAAAGTVMQSVLQNPLASPFGLGISAGAGLGAAVVMVMGLSSGILGMFFLPAVSLLGGLGTVILVIGFSSRIDRSMSNTTIILTGMVLSLFLNAIMSMLATVSTANAQRFNLCTLGSFSMKGWDSVLILFVVTVLCMLLFMFYAKEMDVMTFGEEQALSLGVNLKFVKRLLICIVAVLTGTAVAFVGIIGFVDLIAPHVVRRFFGSSHRLVLPASALFGGTFMVLCDLAARTLAVPREIPIGSITALIGSPFFIYIYFVKRKER